MFKRLSIQEEEEFRQWAHANYIFGTSIPGHHHPIVQEECVKMNRKHYQV